MGLKKTKTGSPVDLDGARATEIRNALTRRMFGEFGLAMQAVHDDPVLRSRLDAASAAGMPAPDLTDVPLYRRPQAVEAALDEWEGDRERANCDACGSITRRFGPGGRQHPDDRPPAHEVVKGRFACGWCAAFLREHGEAVLRAKALRAAAGLIGTGYGQDIGVRLAVEVPHLVTGEAWGHINPEAAAEIVRQNASKFIGSFCFTEAHRIAAAIPGLPGRVWTKAEVRALHTPVALEPDARLLAAEQAERDGLARVRAANAKERQVRLARVGVKAD